MQGQKQKVRKRFSEGNGMNRKKVLIGSIFCSALMAFSVNSADARVISVEVKGKDLRTAEQNARVAATRQVMLSVTDEKFIREHTKEIRSDVIAGAEKYVTGIRITEKNEGGRFMTIKAEVDVNQPKLSAYLKSLGAVIVPAYDDVYEERRNLQREASSKIFGETLSLGFGSEILPAVSQTPAVTEETVPGTDLSGDGQTVYEPGEMFWVYYRLPDYSDITAKSDRSIVTINLPETPPDYENSLAGKITDSYRENGDREGYFRVRAPSRSGNYEVRLFSKGKNESTLLSRLGFSVKTEDVAKLSLERNILLPEETFVVQIEGKEMFPGGSLIVAPSGMDNMKQDEIRQKKIFQSKDFDDFSDPFVEIKAPAQPGSYSVYLFTGCSRCEGYENNRASQLPYARLDFRVTEPSASSFSGGAVSVPAEIPSGSGLGIAFACGEDWRKEKSDVVIENVADHKKYFSESASCSDRPYFTKFARNFSGLGDYRVTVSQGKDENLKAVTAEFRVVPNSIDRKTVPSVNVPSRMVEQDSSMYLTGVGRSYWSDTAFLSLVPKNLSRDLKPVLEYAGDKIKKVGRGYKFSVNFSVVEPGGDYELRLYDSAEEGGTMQFSVPMHVMTDTEMAQHKKEIGASVEKYLNEPDREQSSYKENLIETFHVPEPPRPQPLVTRSVLRTDADLNFSLPAATGVALKTSDCDKYIDDEIRSMTRIDITLGREGDFEGELGRFSKTLLLKMPLPDGSTLKKVQESMDEIQDMYSNTIAGLDQLSEQDYTGALKTAMLMMIKTGMNHCSSEECLKKLLTKNSKKFRERMARMSDQGFQNYYDTLKTAIGKSSDGKKMLDNLVSYRKIVGDSAKRLSDRKDTASNALDVVEDVSTLAGTLAGGDYTNKEAYANAAAAILAIEFPVYVAAAKLSYQAYLSSRDFARDVAVLRMYGKWKKVGADSRGSMGYEDFARIWKDDWKLHKDSVMRQAKEVMIKTLGNELTKKVLHGESRDMANEYFRILRDEGYEAAQEYIMKTDFITEDEVYDFMEAQFKEWEKAENLNTDYGRELRDIKNEFKMLNSETYPDCEKKFYSWYRGQAVDQYKDLKWGERTDRYIKDRAKSLWYRGCPEEMDAFQAYYQTKKEIELELRKWNRDRFLCRARDIKNEAKNMVCELVNGRYDYLSAVGRYACDCGWNAAIADGEVVTGSELRNYRREAEIVNVMSAIGNHDVLHCLCNYGRVSHGGASSSVGISFSPGATGLASGGECGRNQRGSCFASGWSCWHFTMPTDDEGLRRCGYAKALKNAKDKHDAIKSAVDETRQCNADYDQIIKEAKRREMEIKKEKWERGEL
jgi:hypothetical protein